MDHSVEVTVETSEPLTAETLSRISGLGGSVWVFDGEQKFEMVLTVRAPDVLSAVRQTASQLGVLVRGTIVAISAITSEEAALRQSEDLR